MCKTIPKPWWLLMELVLTRANMARRSPYKHISYGIFNSKGFSLPKFDLSNSSLEEFQQPEFEGYRPKTSKSVSENISTEVRESPDTPLLTAITIKGKGWYLGIIIQGPKAVNTATLNSSVVNAMRENQANAVKASTCWV
ncbi:hypothetical protein Tco_0132157 [Tanacetum coccineum]